MIMWCDHCLLVALWFRFHIELAKCLLFGAAFSDLISKCERQKPLRTRRERSGAPHASLVYHLVVAWVVWNNICFFVWHFVMTVMSSFWLYLFVGIVFKAWPKIWPVGQLYWVGVCLLARMCVTFARMVLMHTNVEIVSSVRSRPLIQVSFHVPFLPSYCVITYFGIQQLMNIFGETPKTGRHR